MAFWSLASAHHVLPLARCSAKPDHIRSRARQQIADRDQQQAEHDQNPSSRPRANGFDTEQVGEDQSVHRRHKHDDPKNDPLICALERAVVLADRIAGPERPEKQVDSQACRRQEECNQRPAEKEPSVREIWPGQS